MKQLKLSLLLSLPFFIQTAHSANVNASEHTEQTKKHKNLGEHNEQVKNLLALLDGNIINAEIIKVMIEAGKGIQNIQLGEHDPLNRNHRIGRYPFKGVTGTEQYFSVAQLAKIEQDFVGDPELNQLLIQAKSEFEGSVAKFMGRARGVKEVLVKLIEESCKCHSRHNSLLLAWANAPEEHEMLVFHTDIQSFKALNDFCQDLMNYLGDLMTSCPKAMKQFKDKQAQSGK